MIGGIALTKKKKIVLIFIVLFGVFSAFFCFGYRNNLAKEFKIGKQKLTSFIWGVKEDKKPKKDNYTSTINANKYVDSSLVISKQVYDVTFDPNDETKNSVLKLSEETTAKKENKEKMSKEQFSKSYEDQGYIVIWDSNRKVEVIKNNYINNPKVDGVFVLKPSKITNIIDIYKVDSNGKLEATGSEAYKKVSDLKAETIDMLKKGLLVFGSKEDAKKLAGYD